MKMNSRLISSSYFLLILCFSAAYISAETWNFTANRVTSIQREGENQTILDGQTRVVSDDLIIEADHIELIGSDNEIIKGNGSVSLTDIEDGVNIQSNSFYYDRELEIINFRGLVTLLDEEEGIVIRCESLDLYEKEDLVILQSSVRLIQEEDNIVGRGEFAKYYRETDLLELTGKPVVWQNDDRYNADRINVNLNTDEISMEGRVEGKLISNGGNSDTDAESATENQQAPAADSQDSDAEAEDISNESEQGDEAIEKPESGDIPAAEEDWVK